MSTSHEGCKYLIELLHEECNQQKREIKKIQTELLELNRALIMQVEALVTFVGSLREKQNGREEGTCTGRSDIQLETYG